MENNTVKFGFVGLGGRGMGMLKTLLACDGAKVVAVCDREEDRALNGENLVFEKTGEKPEVFLNYDSMLENSSIDAVMICSSWDAHVQMSVKAMRKGIKTAVEVAGAYDLEDCWELVKTYEETKTPFMMLENCCFDRFELLVTALHRAGKLGEIVHCHGGYRHEIREEILGGNVNRHYRLKNYINRNCENYPTHELGPIAKLLDINRGNRLLSLVSVSSKSVGLQDYAKRKENPDKRLIGQDFKQGDIVNTLITCADGTTISIVLDTALFRYYSREFTVNSTRGICSQELNAVILEGETPVPEWEPNKTVAAVLNNAEKYAEYLPDFWKDISDEERELGHGGMDYFTVKAFVDACLSGSEMPIDVYDAATWMAITPLTEISIRNGGAPQTIPDFTRGQWMCRERKDVCDFPKIHPPVED